MRSLIMKMVLTGVILVFTASQACGSWLVYHKPEFKGKVIDAQTKEPIQGAVVVVMYTSHPIISGPGGGSSSVIHVKETMTDVNGEFHIPSYTTLIQPNSFEDVARFLIYKPGYGDFPNNNISPPRRVSLQTIERFFVEKTFGKEAEMETEVGPQTKSKVIYGVVELPKLETKEERLRAVPSTNPGELSPEDIPLLYEAINKERKRFGLGPVGRVPQ
jgi:hypothetical protein